MMLCSLLYPSCLFFYIIHLVHDNNSADDKKTEILNCTTTNACLKNEPPFPSLNFPFNACIGENAERKNAG